MDSGVALTWRQYRLERRMFWRNPSAAFFNFLLPLILLFLIAGAFGTTTKRLDTLIPGLAAMNMFATTFNALAYNMTFLREQGVLKRIRGTPMPSISYLAAIAGNAVTNAAFQIAIITVTGRVFFGTGWPRDRSSVSSAPPASRRVPTSTSRSTSTACRWTRRSFLPLNP